MFKFYVGTFTNWYENGEIQPFAVGNPDEIPASCKDLDTIYAESYEDALTFAKSHALKSYYTIDNIGKVKYTVNFHNGFKTHPDGSAFYDLRTFTNKKKRDQFIQELTAQGYRERPFKWD